MKPFYSFSRVMAAAVGACIALSPLASHSEHSDGWLKNRTTIKARVVTGTNRYLGTPLSDLGPPFGTAGFSNVGAYNPAGTGPLPLTPRARPSTRLATFVDPDFLAIVGRTPADVDPSTLNVLINDIPVNVSPAGDLRIRLDGELGASATEPTLAEPSNDVTLAAWARANGVATIHCGIRRNHLSLRLRDLLPNRLYTVWAIVAGPDGLAPLPMGGVPNVVVTDAAGAADFSRTLRRCLTDPTSTDGRVMLIDIVLHSDQQLYGAMPDLPLAGLFTGAVNQTHLEFPIRGVSLR